MTTCGASASLLKGVLYRSVNRPRGGKVKDMTIICELARRMAAHRLVVLVPAGVLVTFALIWLVLPGSGQSLPDFSRFDTVQELKQSFFAYLAPIVREQNDEVRRQRRTLLQVVEDYQQDAEVSLLGRWRLYRLSNRYGVSGELDTAEKLELLLRRVDVVPLELALVQAAKESGWGRSRFAVEANNLFGHWCFEPGCGLVPATRAPGARHELRVYGTIHEGIASYIHNLNTHPRYRAFRQLRAQQRDAQAALSGRILADGLLYYSERREAYVEEVKTMIGQYRQFVSGDGGDTQA